MRKLFVLPFLFSGYAAFSQQTKFGEHDFSKIDSLALNYIYQGDLDPVKAATDLTIGLEKEIDKYKVIFRWTS